MYTLIVYGGGRYASGLLLSATPERMRVVIQGRSDTVEFHHIDGRWRTETGSPVEFGAVLAANAASVNLVRGTPQTRALAAS